jgi:hypothetical protein
MAQATKLLILMVCIGAAATAMSASGLTEELGQSPQTGTQDDINDSEESFRSYSASRGESDTSFIGSIIAGVDKVVRSFQLIFALHPLLTNLGVPGWLATFISAPIYFSFGLYVLYLLTGRRTTSRI